MPQSFAYRCFRPCTHKLRLVTSGWSMSGLLPKADMRQRIEHVCLVPIADLANLTVLIVAPEIDEAGPASGSEGHTP